MMKYCPYCGVSLPGDAASFCPECGKALRERKPGARDVKRKRPPAEQRRQRGRQEPRRPKNPMDENYDGYYNDVRPADADQLGKQSDPDLVKRVACVIAGAVGIIALAIVLMIAL